MNMKEQQNYDENFIIIICCRDNFHYNFNFTHALLLSDEDINQKVLNDEIQDLEGPMTRARVKKVKEVLINLMAAKDQNDEMEAKIVNLITLSEDGMGIGHAAQI